MSGAHESGWGARGDLNLIFFCSLASFTSWSTCPDPLQDKNSGGRILAKRAMKTLLSFVVWSVVTWLGAGDLSLKLWKWGFATPLPWSAAFPGIRPARFLVSGTES